MTSKLFISDLQGKEEIESTFLVKVINALEDKTGKKYFNIILTDSTGDLEARYWHFSPEIENTVTKNSFVRVRGKVNFYQGRRQFVISAIQKIDSAQIHMDDYVMKSHVDPEEMYGKLLDIVDNLKDVYIKDLLRLILTDGEIARRLKIWQAGKSIHHAYQSGLLEHILSCSQLASTLSRHYKVNENYVIAGCILHDLCKVYELTDGLNVEYTEEGKLVGHLVKGLEIVDRFAYKIKNFPHHMKMHLKHILLSHHGEYEYGSPKIPQTSEAFLVHLIDLMDSRMASVDVIKKTDSAQGNWSGYIKHLDRIIYKSELPFYSEYVQDYDMSEPAPPKTSAPAKEKFQSPNPKTNLGKILGQIKIED
jgi:3'-5' exoribonuclease